MRLLVIALVALGLGCKGQGGTPQLAVDPVAEADAQKFAEQLATHAKACDPDKLALLIDRDAMAAKFAAQSTLPNAKELVGKLATSTVAARILCAWLTGVDEYRVIRVKRVGGQPHPILRRTIKDKRSGATIVAYDELQLGTTRSDRQVRLVDAFSFAQGVWISQLLGPNAEEGKPLDFLGELPVASAKAHEARDLLRQGKPADALAIIDALPTNVRNKRGVQMMRVRAASAVSEDAYKQALAELAKVFPDDPAIALVQVDGAMVRSDYQTALRWIDILDGALGGDALQTANRALVLHSVGDLDKALAQADKAIEMEPTLTRAWQVKLDVVVAQKRWPDAIAVMTELEANHGVHFDEAKVRGAPAMAELVETAEFKDWLAKRR